MLDLDASAPSVRCEASDGALRCVVAIEAPAQTIWAQLTVARRVQPFHGSALLAEPLVVGGPIVYRTTSGQVRSSGTVTALQPPAALSYTMRYSGLDDPPSRVRWVLRESGQTVVEVVHDALIRGSRSARLASLLWPLTLEDLKRFVEVEVPELGDDWPRRP